MFPTKVGIAVIPAINGTIAVAVVAVPYCHHRWTPESVGDYASGTNHVLPTYGYARMYSGVSLDSFTKKMTVQSLSYEGLQVLGPHVAKMAEVEGLDAHKRAVTLRLESSN